jgi:hypothetical protein
MKLGWTASRLCSLHGVLCRSPSENHVAIDHWSEAGAKLTLLLDHSLAQNHWRRTCRRPSSLCRAIAIVIFCAQKLGVVLARRCYSFQKLRPRCTEKAVHNCTSNHRPRRTRRDLIQTRGADRHGPGAAASGRYARQPAASWCGADAPVRLRLNS